MLQSDYVRIHFSQWNTYRFLQCPVECDDQDIRTKFQHFQGRDVTPNACRYCFHLRVQVTVNSSALETGEKATFAGDLRGKTAQGLRLNPTQG